jgi:GT2 family glycosyltransferase
MSLLNRAVLKTPSIRRLSVKALKALAFPEPRVPMEDESIYALSLEELLSRDWKADTCPKVKAPFWSLPHGKTSDCQITIHPERPSVITLLQAFGYGGCLWVHGALLASVLAHMPWGLLESEADVLHALVLLLAQHHLEDYVVPPHQAVYRCELAYEASINAHRFQANASHPALLTWLRQEVNRHELTLDDTGQLIPIQTKERPFISILIPFRDAPDLLQQVIESVLKQGYPHFEVIGINNQSQSEDTLKLMANYRQNPHIRFVDYDASFNYAAMMNLGASQAKGELLLQLNNDVEFYSPDALTQLAQWAMCPHVGAVGGVLFYPDGRIQHAGCYLGLGGHIGHLFRFKSLEHLPFAWGGIQRPVTAITGALLMIRKSLYHQLGGMDATAFQVGFNDMDLCLKAKQAGYTNLCLSTVRGVHHEGLTRKKQKNKAQQNRERQERKAFYQRYAFDLSRFDETLSRGFDMTNDFGDRSSFVWHTSLRKRLFTGRLPFTNRRFSLYECANGRWHSHWDTFIKESTP